MSARVSLHRTNCAGRHAFGCVQFVAAEAYMLGSAE